MKKVAFITQMGNTGGTEISLINLLNSINPNQMEITVVILGRIGKIAEQIPSWVHIRVIELEGLKKALLLSLKKRNIIDVLKYAIGIIRIKYYSLEKKKGFKQYSISLSSCDKETENFDVAIAWALPNSFQTVFTTEKVNAIEKWLWVHLDVSHETIPSDALEYFVRFNRIFCVSKACKLAFDRTYPTCSSKTEVFYNLLDVDKISRKSYLIEKTLTGAPIIVTCGRLSPEKNALWSIRVVRELLRRGHKGFKWFFIGDGIERELMEKEIGNNGLEEYITMLGEQDNPYPIMKQADIYVQMSSYESFCLTLAEAQILGVPAISTGFPSAYEIVDDGVTGIITSSNWISICDSIADIIKRPELLRYFKENLKNYKMNAISCGDDFVRIINHVHNS